MGGRLELRSLALVGVLMLAGSEASAAQQLPNGAPATWEISADLSESSREFDFWVGEWDVNLRVIQDDQSWKDTHQAQARIYPILSGKAVLELWDSTRIKGYSLRYYDQENSEWVLWLNWPNNNRAGSSSLTGTFRHGRGDFLTTSRGADGVETISRYSFNDITPWSLRWDDADSSDGGRTWQNSWIMEWSRREPLPTLPTMGGEAHTFANGSRCNAEPFRRYEFLSGHRTGRRTTPESATASVLTGYKVLGGCAVLAFLGGPAETAEAFSHLTWNRGADAFELTWLMSESDHPAERLFSDPESEMLDFRPRDGSPEAMKSRITIEHLDDSGVRWTWFEQEDSGWREIRRWDFDANGD